MEAARPWLERPGGAICHLGDSSDAPNHVLSALHPSSAFSCSACTLASFSPAAFGGCKAAHTTGQRPIHSQGECERGVRARAAGAVEGGA